MKLRHLTAALVFATRLAGAHPEHEVESAPVGLLAAAAPGESVAPASVPANRATIAIEDGHRVIRSNGWPDHTPGAFPRRGNPNSLSPQDYTFRVPVKPTVAAKPVSAGHWFFGVALNGVPFEAGTAEAWKDDMRSGWHYEAMTGHLDLGLDEHHAHVQRTGAYHYHGLPIGLIERLGGDGKRMLQVGWAADGYPIYAAHGHADPKDAKSALRPMKSSYRLKQGARPAQEGGPGGNYDGRFTEDFEYVAASGDLDENNGRFGVTPEFPEGTYHYSITSEFPFFARAWHGVPDPSFEKRGPGPGGRRGPGFGTPPGGPRRGGPPPNSRPPL